MAQAAHRVVNIEDLDTPTLLQKIEGKFYKIIKNGPMATAIRTHEVLQTLGALPHIYFQSITEDSGHRLESSIHSDVFMLLEEILRHPCELVDEKQEHGLCADGLELWSDINLLMSLVWLSEFPEELKQIIQEEGHRVKPDHEDNSELHGDSSIYRLLYTLGNNCMEDHEFEQVKHLLEINKHLELSRLVSRDVNHIRKHYLLLLQLNKAVYKYSTMSSTSVKGRDEGSSSKGTSSGTAEARLPAKDWIDELDKSTKSLPYEKVPDGLLAIIKEQCKIHKVTNPSWSKSITEPKSIHLIGGGLDKAAAESLIIAAKKDYSEYAIKITDSKFALKRHSGTTIQETPEGNDIATCELIVRQGAASFFAVTSGHLILTDEEWEANALTQEERDAITARTAHNAYRLTDVPIILQPPVHFAYHEFQTPGDIATDFYADIAAIPVVGDEAVLERGRNCRMTGIMNVDHAAIDRLEREKCLVDMRGRRLRVEEGREAVFDDEAPLARRLTFSIVMGQDLEEGDSGSVIFIKRPRERIALAIHSGKVIDEDNMYEAALLDRALGELNLGELDVYNVYRRANR